MLKENIVEGPDAVQRQAGAQNKFYFSPKSYYINLQPKNTTNKRKQT